MDANDLIERYFENGLTEVELRDFQQRLETDEAFAQAFQLEQDLMEGIEVMGNQNLKEELKGIYKEEVTDNPLPSQSKNKTQTRRIGRRQWLLAAAAVLALVLTFWWMNRPTPERLYAEYFQPEFDFTEKGSTSDELISDAQATLKKGNYQAALPLLDDLINSNPNTLDYLMARGIALMETEQFSESIQTFIQAGTMAPYAKNEALWYQGLALLKQGNLKESYRVLKQIPEESSRYNDAEALAKRLSKIY